MISFDEAEDAVGAEVRYGPRQRGVITGVNQLGMVMVRYDGELISKATLPRDLNWVHQLRPADKVHRELDVGACGTKRCRRRHDYIIVCVCGRKFWTGKLKYSLAKARDHQRGKEKKP